MTDSKPEQSEVFPKSAQTDAESIKEAKKSLRALMKSRTAAITCDRNETANAIYRGLTSIPSFLQAKTIALFIDFKNEIPTRPFLPKLFEQISHSSPRARVAVPFCRGCEMTFVEISPPLCDAGSSEPVFTDLAPGAYGILEPKQEIRNDEQRRVAPQEIDVMIAPGLAFSPNGARLGRGAGFYDRYLPLMRRDAIIIGIAYDEQILDAVPTDAFDMRVSAIVTPTRVIQP